MNGSHRRRYDAEQNRARILVAARAVFATDGLDVPLREIARRAEVGPATLYRHFATKEALAKAAFADEMDACRAIVDASCAEPDPWHGFSTLVTDICDLHQRNRGFSAAFMATFPSTDLRTERHLLLTKIRQLIARAHQTGQLREDFTTSDLVLMLSAHRAVRADSPVLQDRASQRFAHLVLLSACAEVDPPLVEPSAIGVRCVSPPHARTDVFPPGERVPTPESARPDDPVLD